MNIQMIISGVGGQGVLLLTTVFSEVALKKGYPIIGSEDHGMSQRGGSVITHLKIGDFDSPLVKKGSADILFSLEKNEAYKTLHYLKPSTNGQNGGLCFINGANPNDFMSPEIMTYLKEEGIEVYIFGADRLARENGIASIRQYRPHRFAASHSRFPFPHEKLRERSNGQPPQSFEKSVSRYLRKGSWKGKKRSSPNPCYRPLSPDQPVDPFNVPIAQ